MQETPSPEAIKAKRAETKALQERYRAAASRIAAQIGATVRPMAAKDEAYLCGLDLLLASRG